MSSRIVRTACLSAAAAVALFAVPAASNAAILAQWNFEVNTPADVTNSATGPSVVAEAGTGTLAGVHVSTAADWTTPSGPASANAFSVTDWGTSGDVTGNYWEFSTASTGYENLVVDFDATGSNTGPKNFKIAYSTDGSSYTDFGTYSLINASWSASGTFVNPATAHFSFDFSAVPALDNAATVYFRLIQADTTSINNGTAAAGGTSRIDNVTVVASAIPEPASFGLLATAGALLASRRRSRA